MAAVVAVAPGSISASRGWWSQLLTTFAVECLAMMLQKPYTKSLQCSNPSSSVYIRKGDVQSWTTIKEFVSEARGVFPSEGEIIPYLFPKLASHVLYLRLALIGNRA